jgi:hypothetical protein
VLFAFAIFCYSSAGARELEQNPYFLLRFCGRSAYEGGGCPQSLPWV